MKAQRDIYEEGGPKTKDSREQKHLSTPEPIAEPISWQCYSGWLEAQQIWHKESQLPNIGEERESLQDVQILHLSWQQRERAQNRNVSQRNIQAACLGDAMSCPLASSQQLLLSATSEKQGQLP